MMLPTAARQAIGASRYAGGAGARGLTAPRGGTLAPAGVRRWMPAGGPGSKRLSVTLASNHKSVSVNFDRVTKHLEELPHDVIRPVSHNALELAVRYSSGGFTQSAQAAFTRAHGFGPYSRRVSERADDYIINPWTRAMVEGWRERQGASAENALRVALYNVARSSRGFNYPLALFTGTVKMRERKLPQKVYEEVRPQMERLIKAGIERIRRAWMKRAAMDRA